ncbi:MAG: bifunctional folylpolyglutamate synthase/dihydrofolate synthase [Chloroflexota bacterium]|nr:bifunctional folylpolyglutamate synthase/dihydrofolate synthase [Chloroflexota bacterium]
MTYAEALRWIYGFADLERGVGHAGRDAYAAGPARTRRLLRALGDPHHGLTFVHVAGSKGKGSVCALVASAAEAAGLRTGAYTQPHLHSFRERIAIDGRPIDAEAFADLCERLAPQVERLSAAHAEDGPYSTFELATVLALAWFAEQQVGLAVIEVGLGGRLDATRVIDPAVVGLTTIVLEHTRVLGETLEAIAREKAGIIKPGVPVVAAAQSGEALAVFRAACRSQEAPLTVAEPLDWAGDIAARDGRPLMLAGAPDDGGSLPVGLAGPHQRQNAAVAWHICRALADYGLPIDRGAIRAGFGAASWPGRLEVVAGDPLTIVDGAHTPEAVAAVVEGLGEAFHVQRGPVIFGSLRDKRVPLMLDALRGYATRLLVVRPDHPRGWLPERMVRRYGLTGQVEIASSTEAALRQARAACRPGEAVLATGSLAVAADVRAAAGVPHEVDPEPWAGT